MIERRIVIKMSKKSEIGYFVGKKIRMLQMESELGAGKAMMADLRRGIGHEPGERPQLFGIILLDMPQEFMGKRGNATEAEWSCYTALTLFALHQQGFGLKDRPMHVKENISMGRALSKMAKTFDDPNAEKRSLQKLQAFATSVDMGDASYHLKSMIQLLRSKGIPIDYEMLAEDLYEFQSAAGKNRVNLRWGQDFYLEKNKKEITEDMS